MMMAMRTRLKDLAHALGLSVSTVHSILHNRPNFNERTRERVLQKAKELNYQPNWLARSLTIQKTNVIGVIVPSLARSIFPDILQGIDSVVHKVGYQMVISNSLEDPAREEQEISTLIRRQVDGLIIASSRVPEKKGWKMLEGLGLPTVLVDRNVASVPFVGADNERIGFVATQHLIEQGYRNIGHLSRRNVATGFGRYYGYVKALRDSGIRVRRDFVLEVRGQAGGYQGTKDLLRLTSKPDAIFAASDPIAIGAMIAVQESGARIPTDIGIIGVGNTLYTEYLRCSLSTVDQRSEMAGRAAGSILLRLIKGERVPDKPMLLEPELIIRDSSCRIPIAGRKAILVRDNSAEFQSDILASLGLL
jgi:LacI family transcriptional regulator, galactose operon repressor